MKNQVKFRLKILVLFWTGLFISSNLFAKEAGRKIEIQWNSQSKALSINQDGNYISGNEAYSFELIKDDNVLLIGQARAPATNETIKIQIEYTITGYDVIASFSKFIKDTFGGKDFAARNVVQETVQVTDDLLPGGILAITFRTISKKENEAEKEETKIVKFRIKDEYPWFFGSIGMIFTWAKNPEVAIIKTNNIVSFDSDGDTKQVYEQRITTKDNTINLRPLQSAVSFLNFRINNPIYLSLGLPLNESIFKEPMIGLSYYVKVKNVGFAGTIGAYFHKETEIDTTSGFDDDKPIDPVLGLTVEEIPTIEKYRARLFFGISFRF